MEKIIHYRDKCIGCSVCFELQPDYWRMSKKDGKATLLRAIEKKSVYQLAVHPDVAIVSKEVAKACPVNIIKVI